MKKAFKNSVLILFILAILTVVATTLSLFIMSDLNEPHIHSITELNKDIHPADSHDGVTCTSFRRCRPCGRYPYSA